MVCSGIVANYFWSTWLQNADTVDSQKDMGITLAIEKQY